MSLLIWLPLTNDLSNKGLSSVTVTNTNVTIDHTDANLGGCGYFNGSARIQISLPSGLTSLKNTTVCGWLKGNGPMGGISHDGNVDKACCTFVGTSWQYPNGTNWGNITGYSSSSEWRHVAITTAEDTITCYLNGEVITTSSVTSATKLTDLTSANFIELGSDFPGGNEYLTGRICDFRVYNHCLSKREVKELAKGLCMHLSLDWGGNPNMIKNSYTWMNKNTGANNQWTDSGLTYTKAVIEDDNAPCKWITKITIANAKTSNVGGAGVFYGTGAQGLALTDLVEGETYTYSFWAKSDSGLANGLSSGAVCESQTHVSNTGFGTLDSSWRKHTVTFKWTKTTKLTACFYVTVPASSTVDFQLCGLKLEKGSIATPYIPHVEEVAYTSKGFANKYYQDCSGYNIVMTKTGTPIVDSTSPRGITSTNFNQTGYLYTSSFNKVFTAFTIACWLKIPSTISSQHFLLGTFNNWTNNGVGVWRDINGGLAYSFLVRDTSASSYGSFKTPAFTANTWQHWTATWDGVSIKHYLNGELKSTATYGSSGSVSMPVFYLGNSLYNNAPTSEIDECSVSDFRIYATTLSADDIKELYNVAAQIDKSGKIYCNTYVEV